MTDLLVDVDRLAREAGWQLKPEGLCRGDVCVPLWDRSAVEPEPGRVSVAGVAAALGARAVVDAERDRFAISEPAGSTGTEVGQAVDFELDDVDGVRRSLGEWAGKKKLLVCWASW